MVERDDPLSEYNSKRDFTRTAEPKGAAKRLKAGKRFLIQKHDATRLHYDFRLEWKGVLKSWAVTRGPSLNPQDKRLAVRTEDHPMAYGDFEGTIPQKQYGGGTVMLWDTGWWEPDNDPDEGLKEGKLKFHIHGERMHGGWTLVRMKPRNGEKRENWLLIKEDDTAANAEGESLLMENSTSVKTGRSMEEIASGRGEKQARVWQSEKSVAQNLRAGAVAPVEKPSRRSAAKQSAPKQNGKRPAFRKPQLAKLVSDAPAGDEWLNEAKFDGYRLMIAVGKEGIACYTRTGLDWTEKFPDIVAGFSDLDCDSALIDGEAVAAAGEGSKFSALQKAIKTGGETRFYAFDLLHLNGKDLSKRPLVERKQTLKSLIETLGGNRTLQYSEHVQGNGEKVFKAMCKAGQEGIIAKRADAPYREGRAGNWLKIKCTKRQEFVIGGYSPSDKRGRAFASLLVGAHEGGKFVYQGRVGTGFDEDLMEELATRFKKLKRKTSPFDNVPEAIARDAIWLAPTLVAEVDFAEFTDDGHIRHGAFEGLREDKEASAVTPETKKRTSPRKAETASEKRRSPRKETDAESDVLGIRITHADRLLFSDPDITKVDLARYYGIVAERMLPFAAKHPASILRCPQGPDHQCFYQKHASDGFPDEIHQVPIEEADGDVANYLYVDDAKGLVAAVQMGTIEFHIWGSTVDRLDAADRLVFDLDPDPSVTFETVKTAAVDVRKTLEDIGLKSVAMVSGGKGIHVIVPLSRKAAWADAKAFTKALSARIADQDPDHYIATMSKAKRKGRIFIDWLRNERGATAVAPYSVRARKGGPVATPVSWEELGDLDTANGFHIPDILGRIEGGTDPWAGASDWKQGLTKAMLKMAGAET